jgi:D-beta-D-heptose 7-phosphate kinase/D-beta-D-heptose 1-phosphate adenosyltransferase
MATPQQKKLKVLLIGDYCVDEYHYGTVDRLSPEAPVPVFKLKHKRQTDGMAGNVANNLKALHFNVTELISGTSTKTRIIDKRSNYHLVRIDNDVECDPINLNSIKDITKFDAVVISDYDKGAVTYELIQKVRQSFAGPIIVDTKKRDLARLNGCIVKINKLEYEHCTSVNDNLIVTLGSKGAIYNNTTYPSHEVDVSDVCGAGDTFLAAFTYQFLLTDEDYDSAITFAIKAAAITVQHAGVYSPTLEEIMELK